MAMWYCKRCNYRQFNDADAYDHHVSAVHGEYYSCENCPEKFRTDSLYRSHRRAVHPLCEECRTRFKNNEALNQHIHNRHPKCPQCSKKFGDRNALRDHMAHAKGHKKKASNTKATSQALTIYQPPAPAQPQALVAYAPSSVHCDLCKTRFDTLASLDKHDKLCHEMECMYCRLSLKTFATYIDHTKKEHHFPCGDCPATFHSSNQKTDHQRTQHRFDCTHCQNWFTTPSLLNNHIATFHMLKCNIPGCDAGIFTNLIVLQQHKAQAHVIKCGHCAIICKTFELHEKHIAEAHALKCDITGCSSGVFNTATTLAEHKALTHQIKCSKCPKTSATHAAFEEHMQASHSFFCSECPGATFASEQEKRDHNWNSHRETGTRCYDCGLPCRTEKEIHDHILSKHASNKNTTKFEKMRYENGASLLD